MTDLSSLKKKSSFNKAIIVCGPTATGKTDLAAELAQTFNGELISADSRQVYKGLDIVTGKDRPKGVKLWGYDVVDPKEEWSVSQFLDFVQKSLVDIWNRGRLPIVVGGTGLYLKSLIEPIDTMTVKPNKKLRQQLENLTVGQLQTKLQQLNLSKWNNMNHSDQNNPRRLIRAIEVANFTPLSIEKVTPPLSGKNVYWLGLNLSKEQLQTKIKARVHKRMNSNYESELKIVASLSKNNPAFSALGYDILLDYEVGKIDRSEAIKQWVASDLAYAERQVVWFKKQPQIHWFEPTEKETIVLKVSDWYSMA